MATPPVFLKTRMLTSISIMLLPRILLTAKRIVSFSGHFPGLAAQLNLKPDQEYSTEHQDLYSLDKFRIFGSVSKRPAPLSVAMICAKKYPCLAKNSKG